jgi:putative hydrolase of the HAD superfamily
MSATIEAIIFDLDDTLTDRAASIHHFSQQFYQDFQYRLHENIPFDAVHHVIQIGDGGGYRPKEDLFREIQTELRWMDSPGLETISEYWHRVSAQRMQLRAGVHETLAELMRRGYKLGMITNGKTVVQNATIDATDIRQYFSVILISEECGFRKPSPDIFHLALSSLQTSPATAVYVGDNPEADVQGAMNAGLQSIWFAKAEPWRTELPPPQHQISQIPQLLEILAKQNRESTSP